MGSARTGRNEGTPGEQGEERGVSDRTGKRRGARGGGENR
jgi:hypothetical protein